MPDLFWRIESRSSERLYSDDWRQKLAVLLGYRPRRVSLFAESVMYGALMCLSRVSGFEPSSLSTIRLNSSWGAYASTRKAVESSLNELPLPFTFLQSQMSQALVSLVSLVSALEWHGDASITMTENNADFMYMSLLQANHRSILLGCADELSDASANPFNHWLYLVPCSPPEGIVFDCSDVWARDVLFVRCTQNQVVGAR